MAKKKVKKRSRINIVWVMPTCESATLFSSQEKAEIAAAQETITRRYTIEAFHCDRQHTSKGGKPIGTGWHVRGKAFH
ncbi:MAG: hypothetical protein ABSE40_17530 [Candidatus Sulfotelmatobacter sp.]